MKKITLLLILGLLSTSLLVRTQDQASPTPVPETTAAGGGGETPAPETSAAAGGGGAGETTPAPETSAAAGGETTPAPETSAAAGGGGAAANETTPAPGNTTAGNETGNATAGGAAAGGAAGNESAAGNETGNVTALELNAGDSALVFINFQNGWINENGTSEPNALENFRNNAQALNALGQAFGLPTFFVGSDNLTYGDWWSILSVNNTNVTYVWLNESGLAFANQDFLSQLEASGKRNVILAALTVDSDLVHNAIAAEDLGYKSWAIVDASPYYEPGDYLAGLQNLGVAGIQGTTWFALSRFLLNSQPDKMQQVNDIYSQFLTGTNINNTAAAGGGGGAAGGETPAPSESPAPSETPAPGETTMAPAETTPAPETTAASGGRRRRFL